MSNKQLLSSAKALIQDESHWTQESFANTEAGQPVWANDPKACKFCSLGALAKTDGKQFTGSFDTSCKELTEAAQSLGYDDVPDLNDNADHHTVLRMFDLAIEACGD